MNKQVVYVGILGTFILAGCGSKQDANEKNFSAAISQYLDKKGELCLGVKKWPVDVTETDLSFQKIIPNGTAGQMAALAAVGLVSSTDIDVNQSGTFSSKMPGRIFKVKRYTLTDAGKRFYREKEVEQFGLSGMSRVMQGDICYGKKSVDKIVKWDVPQNLGGASETSVQYLYKIDGLADWAKSVDFQTGFPYVAQIIGDAGKREQIHGVKLTNQGWEALGLDN